MIITTFIDFDRNIKFRFLKLSVVFFLMHVIAVSHNGNSKHASFGPLEDQEQQLSCNVLVHDNKFFIARTSIVAINVRE